jgi:hypothetical protein
MGTQVLVSCRSAACETYDMRLSLDAVRLGPDDSIVFVCPACHALRVQDYAPEDIAPLISAGCREFGEVEPPWFIEAKCLALELWLDMTDDADVLKEMLT